MPDRSDDIGDTDLVGSPRLNGSHDGAVRLATVAAVDNEDEAPPPAFVSAGTTEEHVETIRAELEARSVPKTADAVEAILAIDGDVRRAPVLRGG